MVPPLRIELLGGLRVTLGDRVITRFRTRKNAALLACLAYYPRRSHARDALIDWLWPEKAIESGRNSLSQSLTSLRRQLEPPGVPPGAVIVADRNCVRLNPAICLTDVAEFEAALEAAARASDARAQERSLIEGVRLYQGELLPGFYENWIVQERERLCELFCRAAMRLCELREAAGDLPGALGWVRRILGADPESEEAHRLLIRLLEATGRPEEASRHAVDRALAEQPAPSSISPRRGHRERGVPHSSFSSRVCPHPAPPAARQARSVRPPGVGALLSVEMDGAPVSPAEETGIAGVGGSERAGALPLPVTRFFGREEELARLAALLTEGAASPAATLVTLTGPGGTGKTRLAIEAAWRWSGVGQGAIFPCEGPPRSRPGAWFVPLLDLTDPRRVADRIRDALGLPRLPHLAVLDQVVEVLRRRAGGPGEVLLVLDNFEHLVGEGAAVVGALMERVGPLALLITSRRPLGLPGEREFPVGPLPIPPAPGVPSAACRVPSGTGLDSAPGTRHPAPGAQRRYAERLLAYPGVQLYVDRAQAVCPDFQVTPANAAAVAALCARLEGLPLSLELAAARARVLTPAQMLRRLERRFELLASPRRAVDPRHQSLRATLEWSYRLLGPSLQRFFAALSVFQGGWSLEAAEAVTGEPLALDYLEQLRECSLVLAEEASSHPAGEAQMRFRMLETLREYGREQLGEEERAALEERHAAYFLKLVEHAGPELKGPSAAEWLERLETEYDNLRAALEWCLGPGAEAAPDHQERLEAGLCLAASLQRFWCHRGHLLEGSGWLERALSLSDRAGQHDVLRPPRFRAALARALLVTAATISCHADYEHVYALYQRSLELYRALGDRRGVAVVLTTMSHEMLDHSETERVVPLLEEGLAIGRELGDRATMADALRGLATVARKRGDQERAEALYGESLALCRELGDRISLARILGELGFVVMWREDHDRATALFQEMLALCRQLQDKPGIAHALWHLGNVAVDRGDDAMARSLFEESLAVHREVGNKDGIGLLLGNLGAVAFRQGDAATARAFYEQSLAVRRETRDPWRIALALSALADTVAAQGDHDAARAHYQGSLAIFRQLEDRKRMIALLESLGRLASARGDPLRAARLLGAAEALRGSSPTSPPAERGAAGAGAHADGPAQAAWAEGRSMTLEQAVSYALDEIEGRR